MSAINSRSTKAQLLGHIATLECELRQSRKDLEAQRMLTSIAEGNRAARSSQCAAPRPVRTFMQNGVLMHKVAIGFNRFAIRPVQVAA